MSNNSIQHIKHIKILKVTRIYICVCVCVCVTRVIGYTRACPCANRRQILAYVKYHTHQTLTGERCCADYP